MLVQHRDFSDVLERTINGGVLIATEERADEPSKTSEETAVWLHLTIAGINVLKVEAGVSRHPLIEQDRELLDFQSVAIDRAGRSVLAWTRSTEGIRRHRDSLPRQR